MSEKPSVIVINESNTKSIVSDIFSFTALLGAFWINHQFLGDGIILQIVLAVIFLAMSWARGAKKVIKRMTVSEARQYFCEETS
ncbi:MAG: hypothetical protein ACR2OV_00050 [Hyphomicrobiaceae bacterium]